MPFTNTTDRKQFAMSEVCKHTLQESAWIMVHNHIYISHNTKFLTDHPGTADTDTNYTEEFNAIHN
jgi:hypothetical protein